MLNFPAGQQSETLCFSDQYGPVSSEISSSAWNSCVFRPGFLMWVPSHCTCLLNPPVHTCATGNTLHVMLWEVSFPGGSLSPVTSAFCKAGEPTVAGSHPHAPGKGCGTTRVSLHVCWPVAHLLSHSFSGVTLSLLLWIFCRLVPFS